MGIGPLLRKIALKVTAPMWVPFYIVALVTEWYFLPEEWRLRRRMKAANRWLGKRALRATSGGTIILDWPMFNWGLTRMWWTPDDVAALAPCPRSTDAEPSIEDFKWSPFDRWVYTTYLDPDHGRAMLMSIWPSGRKIEAVRKRYAGRTVVESYSGGQSLEALVVKMKTKQAKAL